MNVTSNPLVTILIQHLWSFSSTGAVSASPAAASTTSSSTVVMTNAESGASSAAFMTLTVVYSIIGMLGLLGNLLVIFVILHDAKMRRSVTNLLILNMAVADANIMLLGLPEIAQFVSGNGWVLGLGACKMLRFHLVVCLYVSVLSLTAVCVERYVAIVHPIRASVICRRKVIVSTIGVTWVLAALCGLPTAIFNTISDRSPTRPLPLCVTTFPPPHRTHYTAYKTIECLVFFVLPVVLQASLYSVVSKHLFASAFPPSASSASINSADQWVTSGSGSLSRVTLHRNGGESRGSKCSGAEDVGIISCSSISSTNRRCFRLQQQGGGGGGESNRRQQCARASMCSSSKKQKESKIVRARHDIIKMLIASVVVYFLCYAPAQLPLTYNLLFATPVPFSQNWYFHALVMTLAYTNSAINPLLYTVFSQKFRFQFSRYLCCKCRISVARRRDSQLSYGRATSFAARRPRSHCNTNDVMVLTSAASAMTSRLATATTSHNAKLTTDTFS